LDLTRPFEQTTIREIFGIVKHRYVENLDLGLDRVLKHRSREFFDKLRWIFVDLRGEIDRPGCERGHVRFQIEHAAALILTSATTPG